MTNQPDHRDLAEDALAEFRQTGVAEYAARANVHALLAIVDVVTDLVSAVEGLNSVEVVDISIDDYQTGAGQ